MDSIGDRMKTNYEGAYRQYLPRRIPLIIRVDGKAFHTLTRGLGKPWDDRLMGVMDGVAAALCRGIQGAEIAYVQSDEISILVHNYKTLVSEPWFANNLQKIVSVSAGIASAMFTVSMGDIGKAGEIAVFDSRVFVIPESEVNNYFAWRQMDASRNAIEMMARAYFSHSECHGKNGSQLQSMLMEQMGLNFNDVEPYYKRGRAVVKTPEHGWVADRSIPIFTQDTTYIEDLLRVDY